MASCFTLGDNDTVVNEVSDEKFEEIHTFYADEVQLVNNGRTFQSTKHGSFHCAIGKNSYSSGIHRIRLKIHDGTAFFGIRSRNIRPVPDFSTNTLMYTKSPSTYGWYTNAGGVANGSSRDPKLALFSREDATFILVLNCDERQLMMQINENSME